MAALCKRNQTFIFSVFSFAFTSATSAPLPYGQYGLIAEWWNIFTFLRVISLRVIQLLIKIDCFLLGKPAATDLHYPSY